jgi:cobalt-zinc-cadmium efflux system membrane fusion protein
MRLSLDQINYRLGAAGTLTSCCAALLVAALLAGCDRGTAGAPAAEATGAATAKAEKPADAHGHDHAHGGGEHKEGGDAHGHDHDHAHGAEHTDEVVLTPEAIRASGIRTARASPRKLVETITAPARVTFNNERMAHVGSVLTGRVAELRVRVGDEVKKGDVLLVIDSTELGEAQSEYIQRHTAVETAAAAVKIAQDNHQAAKELYDKSQGIAPIEVRKYQGELQAAQGAWAAATASLTAARNRLQLLGLDEAAINAFAKSGKVEPKYAIHAPIEGRVVEREVTLGELVGPERERLLTLADLRKIWVVADVAEAKLGQVSVGAEVSVSVPALAAQTFSGKVGAISPQLDSETRTARVRVEVENPDAKLLPGMFATADVRTGGEFGDQEVIAVPEDAIQTVEGEPAIFVPVEGEPNTFAARQVGIGQSVGGMVPVLAGLKAGDRYVINGSFILKAELGKAGAAHEH